MSHLYQAASVSIRIEYAGAGVEAEAIGSLISGLNELTIAATSFAGLPETQLLVGAVDEGSLVLDILQSVMDAGDAVGDVSSLGLALRWTWQKLRRKQPDEQPLDESVDDGAADDELAELDGVVGELDHLLDHTPTIDRALDILVSSPNVRRIRIEDREGNVIEADLDAEDDARSS